MNSISNCGIYFSKSGCNPGISLDKGFNSHLAFYKRLCGDLDNEFFNEYWATPPCEVTINKIKFKGLNKYRFLALATNPDMTDYTWTITDSTGQVVYNQSGHMMIWFDCTPPNNNYPFTVNVLVGGKEGC